MRKLLVLFMIFGLTGCSLFSVKVENEENEKSGSMDSVKHGDMYTHVEVTMKGNDFVDVYIDELGAVSFDGTKIGSKKELGDEINLHSYSSIGREWDEQVKSLEYYIEQNGIDKIELDEDGRAINTDLKAICTISIEQYLTMIKEIRDDLKEN